MNEIVVLAHVPALDLVISHFGIRLSVDRVLKYLRSQKKRISRYD
jgi:hypothetical protein